MVVTFGSRETGPTMLRNKRAACRDGTIADGERNNSVCGAKAPGIVERYTIIVAG